MKRGNVFANLDWLTIFLFLIMIAMGWLNIYSAVYSEGQPEVFSFKLRYGRQFLFIMAAIAIAITILFIDHKFFEFFANFFYLFALFLLLLVLVIGKEINGAKSWIVLGSFQLQPSEFAKPAVAIALAKYLSTFNLKINSLRTYIISAAIIFTPSVLILLQHDAGSAMVFTAFILTVYREGFPASILLVLVGLVLLFLLVLIFEKFLLLLIVAGAGLILWGILGRSIKNFLQATAGYILILGSVYAISKLFQLELGKSLIVILSISLALVIFMVPIIKKRLRLGAIIMLGIVISIVYIHSVDYAFRHLLSDYQQHRVNIMLGFEKDPKGTGYHLNQSKIAIGSGGVSGKGYLKGTQTKLDFVPEQSTDFIFCTVGEEWGFLGSVFILGLFSFFLLRLVNLAERQRSKFARIYGYGIISVFFFHYFVNIAMTIGLFPVIGIPLPFFSYGGSSLWAFTILLFIFLRLDASRMEHIN